MGYLLTSRRQAWSSSPPLRLLRVARATTIPTSIKEGKEKGKEGPEGRAAGTDGEEKTEGKQAELDRVAKASTSPQLRKSSTQKGGGGVKKVDLEPAAPLRRGEGGRQEGGADCQHDGGRGVARGRGRNRRWLGMPSIPASWNLGYVYGAGHPQ